MLSPQRRIETSVIDELLRDPHRFEFFQAMRVLQSWSAAEGLGPQARRVKFRNSLALAFPASEIERLELIARRPIAADNTVSEVIASNDGVGPHGPVVHHDVEITPTFMGLLGVSGALPAHYTELIARRETFQKDFAARAFLDLFSHRAVAMFHAAWRKHRLHLQYEEDRRRHFLPAVLSLAGFGQNAPRGPRESASGGVGDHSLAFFAGAVQQRVTSAVQLERLLESQLGVPVDLEQFCGRMYPLPAAARTLLGLGNGVLGKNALAGERVWQRDLRVRLIIGPLSADKFRCFVPGSSGAVALDKLLMLFTGVSLEYEVNLTLSADAVEGCTLSSGRPPHAGRLGWDTYLMTWANGKDRCDVRYDALKLH